MASNNEIMIDKIIKILKGANEDGIGYTFTASYLMGSPRNLDKEDLKNLSNHSYQIVLLCNKSKNLLIKKILIYLA